MLIRRAGGQLRSSHGCKWKKVSTLHLDALPRSQKRINCQHISLGLAEFRYGSPHVSDDSCSVYSGCLLTLMVKHCYVIAVASNVDL